MKKNTPELILALDVDDVKKACGLVSDLHPRISYFKVGLQLFTACGPEIITFITGKGARVFLDLKLHDIPNTVASAVRQGVTAGVSMMTLHVTGGEDMMKAAARAAAEEAKRLKIVRPQLVGVTVLTSSAADPEDVLAKARTAVACGLDGVVCSAGETALLRKHLPASAQIVTPGIRLSGTAIHDQKRVATIEDAVRAGSSYLVVGRPILQASSPREAADVMVETLQSAHRAL